MYGPFEDRLYSLRQNRAVSDQTRTVARQMFVFAENVILPPSLDISTLMGSELYESGAINWGGDKHRDAFRSTEPATLDLANDSAAALLPFVENLELEPTDIERVIDFWHRSRRFEQEAVKTFGEDNFMALQAMGLRDDVPKGTHEANAFWSRLSAKQKDTVLSIFADDPEPERAALREHIRISRDAYAFSSAMKRLAEKGVPTLARPRPDGLGPKPDVEDQDGTDFEYLVSLYFDNVAMPFPETAIDAMRYRESSRVHNWREKIRSWQENLLNGRSNEREILQELEDASGYIKGASFISTTVGRISPWVTGSLAVATYFLDAMPFHAEVSALLATHTVLDRAGAAIEKSVYGDNPIKADWVMLPPVK